MQPRWWGLRLQQKTKKTLINRLLCVSEWCRSASIVLHAVYTPTGRGWASRPADIHLPVVEGAAHHSVLPRLQHHVAADELLHRPLAVGQQAAQGQLVAAAEGGPKHHDTQVQQVAVCCVRTPAGREKDVQRASAKQNAGRQLN